MRKKRFKVTLYSRVEQQSEVRLGGAVGNTLGRRLPHPSPPESEGVRFKDYLPGERVGGPTG